MNWLIISRAVQGVGGAGTQGPLTNPIIVYMDHRDSTDDANYLIRHCFP